MTDATAGPAPKADKEPKTKKAQVKEHSRRAWLNPWIAGVATLPAGEALNLVWGGNGMMTAATGAGAAIATGYVWNSWSTRHERTRRLATIYTGAACTWCTIAEAHGVDLGMVNAWAFGTILLSGLWNARFAAFSPPHEHDQAGGQKDPLFSRVSALKGARTKRLKEDGDTGRVTATVQLKPGVTTADQVQAERGNIASAVGMSPDEITVRPGPGGRADQVEITFQKGHALGGTQMWPGPGTLGRSVADEALWLGMRSDGSEMRLWIVGDEDPHNPRPLAHTLTTGMTGAGKTDTVVRIIQRIRETRDCVPVIADPAKFGQSFGYVADALGVVAKGKQQVNQLIRNLPAVVEYRAELLGSLERADGTIGYSQWVPECWELHKIPALFIDVEEATDVLTTSDDAFDEAVRKLRSVGVHLMASLQVAVYSNIPRETRGQFGNSLAHGCAEDQDAKFALSAHTRQAGGDPTKWKNTSPGSLIAELVGTPQNLWPLDCRTFFQTRAEVIAELKASKENGHWAEIDPGTKMRLAKGIQMTDEQVTAPLPTVKPDAVDLEESVYADDAEPEEWELEDPGQELEPPTGPSVPLGEPLTDRMTPEQAQEAFELRLEQLHAAGKTELAYGDLADLTVVTGLTRQWVYKKINQAEKAGILVRTDRRDTPWKLVLQDARVGA